jgi:hypothetical protein
MLGGVASHAVNACALDGTSPLARMVHKANQMAREGNNLLVEPSTIGIVR